MESKNLLFIITIPMSIRDLSQTKLILVLGIDLSPMPYNRVRTYAPCPTIGLEPMPYALGQGLNPRP